MQPRPPATVEPEVSGLATPVPCPMVRSMPEISVIMGVHNGGRWLAAAVRSLLAQTLSDWELVMVDNGSTDGAVAAVERELPDGRIRVIRHPEPLGSGPALNVAAAAACGRYLAVLDQDDLAAPRRLELQCGYLGWQTGVGLLGAASLVIDAEGRPRELEPFVGRHEELHAMLQFVTPIRHSSVMFRRELAERVPYRALAGPAADGDFLMRVSEVTRVACLPEVLCHYRWHPANMSQTAGRSMAVHGALVRMLGWRRRAGRLEDADTWTGRFAALLVENLPLGRTYRACARMFRREGGEALAAYYDWLAWRATGGALAGGRYLLGALRGALRSPGTAPRLLRAWLKEPAHQLLQAGGMPDRYQF